ncbi:cytochrome P450 [Paenibacillus sp. MY03]|nr:cytochrome P450 [Paenibacillus sp. MY03]
MNIYMILAITEERIIMAAIIHGYDMATSSGLNGMESQGAMTNLP